jgi:hypothetical protein
MFSEPNGYIVHHWLAAMSDYMKGPKKTRLKPNRLERLLNSLSPQLWFTSLFATVIRCYPYFWPHYVFEKCVQKDPEFKRLWGDSFMESAVPPHYARSSGLLNEYDAELITKIRATKVQKLTNKVDLTKRTERSLICLFLAQEL